MVSFLLYIVALVLHIVNHLYGINESVRGGGVEAGDFVRGVQRVADVVVPDDLAVGGVKKWNAERAGGDGGLGDAFGVALGLEKNVLRTDGELLGFHDADDEAAAAEGVVGRPIGGVEFLDGAVLPGRKRQAGREPVDLPAGGAELAVDDALPREVFRVSGRGGRHYVEELV